MNFYKKMYMRGKKAEIELVRILWKHGFFAIRSPGSGRRARRVFYPDIVAIRKGRIILFEVKLRKHRDTIHIPGYIIEKYMELMERTNGEFYIAVKVTNESRWYLFTVDQLEKQEHNGRTRYVITVSMFMDAKQLDTIL